VDTVMTILREKSGAEFESFLAVLSETGQQSITDVVHRLLYTVHHTGLNPLHHLTGKPVYFVIRCK